MKNCELAGKRVNIDICPFNFKHQFVGQTMALFANHKASCPDRFRLRNELEIGLCIFTVFTVYIIFGYY